jgi:transcription elongation GreA/GreB family factor
VGRRVGDAITYDAPNGKPINVTVVKVEPFKN